MLKRSTRRLCLCFVYRVSNDGQTADYTPTAGITGVPKWTEIAVTGAIIAAGFALFGLAVKYLPIFPAEEHHPVAEPAAVTPMVLEHAGD